MKTTIALCSIAIAAAACGGRDPSASVIDQALGEGATVSDYTSTRFNVITGDPDKLIWMAMGAEADVWRAYCAGQWPLTFAPVSVHKSVQPAANRDSTGLVRGEAIPTVMWRASATWDWTADFYMIDHLFCADVQAEPIATGLSDETLRSNYQVSKGVWAFTARGTLYDAAGASLPYVHAGECGQKDWNDPESLRCNTNIQLP